VRKIRPLLLIVLSLAIGTGAVAIALHWIAERTEVASTKVVVASRDLMFGTQLREGMLEVIEWPASSTLKDPVAEPKQIYQRVINTAIMRGEPLLAAKLAPLGEKGGLSALLHEGTRAVTVKVNEIVGVAGFALPGNYVDVMVNATEKTGKVISKIVLERILVLALAQDASTSETKPRLVNAVTLEVTPQQAEQIDLARSVGSLSLVLRSQVDTGRINTTGASMDDLFKQPAVDKASPARAVSNRTNERPEIIRGSVKTLD
jgi:pilus assembly protein CpaB